jgi:CDP-diacylglycerol--glycerol-3-phosphate 3-phosphatidyltransferase
MSDLEKTRRSLANAIAPPLARLLSRTALTPDAVTWLGFLLTVGAAFLIVFGHLLAAGAVVLAAGLFDMLDGALARLTDRVSRFGGILDSTLDRLSEAAVLLALLTLSLQEGRVLYGVLIGVVLLGSLMVSYIRARVEGLGIECKAGFFTRPERVVIISLGLMLNQFDYALLSALGIIALFSWITVVERLVYAWRQTRTPNHT